MIAIITHVPFEGPGYLADSIIDAQRTFWTYPVFEHGRLPDLEQAEALVFMGGPMSANDDLPFITAELKLLEHALTEHVPVLGICLGSQLLAKALGARVYPNRIKEIGWYPVHWAEEAQCDPVFFGLPSPVMALHWHGEVFDIPAGAKRLAWSAYSENQAFSYGGFAYGLQFHVEVTPEMIADWCAQDANSGDLREVTEPIDPYAHAQDQRVLADTIFRRWLNSISISSARKSGSRMSGE
jgi:GMP synthase-like glutamine amidotransferase